MANNSLCTDFCSRLKILSLTNGKLLNHDELISHLGFTNNGKEHGQHLGTLHELFQRTNCTFCQLAANIVLDDESYDVNK